MKKKIVHVSFNVSNITDINTSNETLEAEVNIISLWLIPEKETIELILGNQPRPLYMCDDTNYKKIKKHTWENEIWNPKLYITNLVKKYHNDKKYKIIRENGTLYVEETIHINGKFKIKMNLRYFPFDKQLIGFNIESKYPADKLELKLYMQKDVNSIETDTDIDPHKLNVLIRHNYSLTEWNIDKYLNINSYNDEEYKFPRIRAFINSKRIYKYYIWNIIFINSLIQFIALSSASIDYYKSEDRLNISVMLLLTNIAFKLANNNSLPNTSYLTHIDKYQITAVGFHSLVILQNVIVKFVNNIDRFDLWSHLFLLGVYLLTHIIFILRTYFIIRK